MYENDSSTMQNIIFFFFLIVILTFIGYFAVSSIVQLIGRYLIRRTPEEKKETPNDEYAYPDTTPNDDDERIRDTASIMNGIERLKKQYDNQLQSSPFVQKLEERGRLPRSQIHPGVFSDTYDNNSYKRGSERSFWSLLLMPSSAPTS